MSETQTNERGEPNSIYMQIHGDNAPQRIEPDHPWSEVTWSRDRVFDSDVEYVRADRALPDSRAGIQQVMAAVRIHIKRTVRHHQSPHDERLKQAYIESRDRLMSMTGMEEP
tara:strand:+ start:12632 stop:12967 length:336 start_codon:yes stop_codon:yes gene_type:complete